MHKKLRTISDLLFYVFIPPLGFYIDNIYFVQTFNSIKTDKIKKPDYTANTSK